MKQLMLAALLITASAYADCPTPILFAQGKKCEMGSEQCPWTEELFAFAGRAEQACKEEFGPEACFYGVEVAPEGVQLFCGPPVQEAAN